LLPAIPATFMAAVTFTYILQAPEGFQLPTDITYPAGFVFAAVCVVLFLKATLMKRRHDARPAGFCADFCAEPCFFLFERQEYCHDSENIGKM
ncbi:MAG: hypothetical protein IKO94_00640, partial [Selenomonadaceae bacterium]|nr:hypothetical protein [Selenomonadaceae bacterium]